MITNTQNEEVWKNVECFPCVTKNEVSSHGRVRFTTSTGKVKLKKLILTRKGYLSASITLKGVRLPKISPVHRLVYQTFVGPIPKNHVIDHIDRNKQNNHLSNLRCVTHSRNILNRDTQTNNFTGFRGVSFTLGAYVSMIQSSTYLGRFTNPIDAAIAYDEKARQLWGENAILNFPNGPPDGHIPTPRDSKRGPKGRKVTPPTLLCRCGCGQTITEKGDFKTLECADRWLIKNPSHALALLLERDQGVCAKCGADTYQVRKHPELLQDRATWPTSTRHRWWEGDHIIPLSAGGTNALSNFQTLCIPCHRKATAVLREVKPRKPKKITHKPVSKYRGVTKTVQKRGVVWKATLRQGTQGREGYYVKFLGYHATEEDAARAYDIEAQNRRGTFFNFPIQTNS